ncbi:hypothetical protein Mapa_005606 [Marchantia paleacea]|nr:hypothetical protein Mapa_005606 [Marchantia paleacea]
MATGAGNLKSQPRRALSYNISSAVLNLNVIARTLNWQSVHLQRPDSLSPALA